MPPFPYEFTLPYLDHPTHEISTPAKHSRPRSIMSPSLLGMDRCISEMSRIFSMPAYSLCRSGTHLTRAPPLVLLIRLRMEPRLQVLLVMWEDTTAPEMRLPGVLVSLTRRTLSEGAFSLTMVWRSRTGGWIRIPTNSSGLQSREGCNMRTQAMSSPPR